MSLFISENYCGDKIFTEIELIIARKLNKVIIWSVHSFILLKSTSNTNYNTVINNTHFSDKYNNSYLQIPQHIYN